MLSSSERIETLEMVKRSCGPLAARPASMLAIGASSFGDGMAARRLRDFWKPSSHATSGERRVTWRMFQAMPSSITNTIRLLSSGLASNATSNAPASSATTIVTAARKPSIRQRYCVGWVMAWIWPAVAALKSSRSRD